MSWPKSAVLSLIEAYKEYPCLYSTKDLNYRNKFARRKAFEAIYEKLQHLLPNVSIQELKMKATTLRSTFIGEHRKFSALVLNGAESYSPNLWYYDRLLFMADPIPNWQVLKTTNGRILTNNSRHKPNILRERKTNNNKPSETTPAVEIKTDNNKPLETTTEVELKTEEIIEINDDIMQSNVLIQMINNSCTPDEEHKDDDKHELFNNSVVNMEFQDSPESISCTSPKIFIPPADDNLDVNSNNDEPKQHVNVDIIMPPADDNLHVNLNNDQQKQHVNVDISMPSVDDNLHMNLNNDQQKQHVNVDIDNPECTKQIQAFCNFVGSSLHMIKNSKAQMAVQRQITKLLYDALDNV
ncbi:PREDICTED: uncharacterized protein LOC108569675 isoform X1 [Nicrophorus vespilloides]|uniref:Uncharacterized protein LOC108569675 isoform X1 n=1 Tax=Nicrophorus vespilloides TaxID=110193 RepID=A0ABM1NJ02_NICVS|nr:PREDICTED: uncharacterized protein LOC108569675 isoform X1 [Nicrophorus vespilloides]